MENSKKPAYPVRGANGVPINFDGFPWEQMGVGLTKRELIAAMAMQGVLSNSAMVENIKETATPEMKADPEQTVVLKAYAKLAVNAADSLLEQLTKG